MFVRALFREHSARFGICFVSILHSLGHEYVAAKVFEQECFEHECLLCVVS